MQGQRDTIWADDQRTDNILWSILCYGSVRALRPLTLFTCCNEQVFKAKRVGGGAVKDNIHVWGLSWAPLKQSDMLFAQMCESKAESPIFLYIDRKSVV